MRRTRNLPSGQIACAISASVCPLGQTLALACAFAQRAKAHAGLPMQEAPKGPLALAITQGLAEQRGSAAAENQLRIGSQKLRNEVSREVSFTV